MATPPHGCECGNGKEDIESKGDMKKDDDGKKCGICLETKIKLYHACTQCRSIYLCKNCLTLYIQTKTTCPQCRVELRYELQYIETRGIDMTKVCIFMVQFLIMTMI